MTTPPPRIIILGPAHPYRGGLAAFNERLARELMAAGYEVALYTFTLQYPNFLFPGKTQYTDAPPPAGLRIERQLHALNPFNWLRVGWLMRRQRPAAVVAAFWLPLLGPALGTALRLARSRHTRTLALVHNLVPHEKRPGDALFARYFAGAADGFIALSESVADDIRRFAPGRPVVCTPHPIYDHYGRPADRAEALAHLSLPPEPRYLLFFGFIRRYKGLDLLLRALAACPDPQLRLIVAGEFYEDEAPYRQLIDELGIRHRLVLRTDYIPDEEVRYYFGAADLVVQPYRTATQSGISQMAYHFGLPMVVTRVGGLPEIVPHGRAGYVVEPQPEAIAAAITDFYAAHRAEALRQGVAQLRRQYGWDVLAGHIQAMLSGLNA